VVEKRLNHKSGKKEHRQNSLKWGVISEDGADWEKEGRIFISLDRKKVVGAAK